MKAFVQERYGSADVLQLKEIDKPPVGDGAALVRVHATSVNPADWHAISGTPFVARLAFGVGKPKNPVPGTDLAGVVEAVGKDVTKLRPGDEVFGSSVGAFAEYACTPEDHLVPKPANLTFEQGAAIPIAATTALQGLRDWGQLRAGQTVLVIGASGGVGTFAVQIAKSLGAEVTGVCSTRNVEMVRSLGADHVIDYTQEDPLLSGKRYDLIFQLAGTASPSRCRRALTTKGTLVLSSGDGRFTGIGRMAAAAVSGPFVSQALVMRVAKLNQADLLALTELIGAGKVKPVIDRTFAFGETPAAVRYCEEGHTRGKVVITVT
ncbi:MAG TPA: NAD(P)-dependent alcohol dehydrogenase [Candidatus Dormibacteraeota bacterium]